jgi:hypothetical protein
LYRSLTFLLVSSSTRRRVLPLRKREGVTTEAARGSQPRPRGATGPRAVQTAGGNRTRRRSKALKARLFEEGQAGNRRPGVGGRKVRRAREAVNARTRKSTGGDVTPRGGHEGEGNLGGVEALQLPAGRKAS